MTKQTIIQRYGRIILIAPILFLGVVGISFLVANSPMSKTVHLKQKHIQNTPSISPSVAPPQPSHIAPPAAVKAIYMTSWVASVKPWRERLLEFIDQSEINALIIDIKDYSGTVSFDTRDPKLSEMGVEEIRVKDLREFIQLAHSKGIYVIARITVFQDPTYAKLFPAQAVQTRSGATWKDRNGLSYVDPASHEFWDHIIRIATASITLPF